MQNTDFQEVQQVVTKYFPRLWLPTEACMSVIATLLLKNNPNPTALVLNGVASTGKNTVLNLFIGMDEITYKSDSFTPRSFVSHYAKVSKSNLEELDLLKRITKKCLIVSDLGVIFGKRSDDVKANLGLLTKALDGEGIASDTGVHGRRAYIGDYMFTMLAGTTPFGYKLWEEMGRFGTRLLFLNMPKSNIGNLILDFRTDFPYQEKVKLCKDKTQSFFTAFWQNHGGFRSVDWNDLEMPEKVVEMVGKLAVLLGRLRALIEIYKDRNDEIQYKKPTVEDPRRAMSLLLNIAKGRALLLGRNQISFEEISLLLEIVLSSCPQDRGTVLRELIMNPGKTLSAVEVGCLLEISPKYVYQTLENLKVLRLVEEIEGESSGGRHPMQVKVSEEFGWLFDEQTQLLFKK